MRIAILCFIVLFSGSCFAKSRHETPPLEFMREYIQIQADTKSIQELGQKELEEAGQLKPDATFQAAIRNGTRIKIKLQYHIYVLKGMRLNKEFDFFREALILLLQQKLKLWNEMISFSKSFVEAGNVPNPKVNYSKMASRMPEINAELDSVEETIFKIAPMAFMALVHSKPDSQNHLSHLDITKDEANSLADTIRSSFGYSLKQEKDIKYPIASAMILLEQLTTKGFKFSDDPWE